MEYILDLLNKIRWDKKLNPEEFTLTYEDKILMQEKEIRYTDIKRIEEPFMILQGVRSEISIPLHRIRKVMKKGLVIWKREI